MFISSQSRIGVMPSGDMLMPMRRETQRMGIDWKKEEWNSSKALV